MDKLSIKNRKIIKRTTISRSIDDVWNLWSTNEGTQKLFGSETLIEMTPFGKYEIYGS